MAGSRKSRGCGGHKRSKKNIGCREALGQRGTEVQVVLSSEQLAVINILVEEDRKVYRDKRRKINMLKRRDCKKICGAWASRGLKR